MDREHLIRSAKHHIKTIIGKPDPLWPFYIFERSINSGTLKRHDEILAWAEDALAHKNDFEKTESYERSNDPIVQQGYRLKKSLEASFKDKYASISDIRFLVQTPDPSVSPGGYSVFLNFIESLAFMGIPALALGWNDDFKKTLQSFKPTVLLATDHPLFLNKIDWQAIKDFRAHAPLHVGLTAQLEKEAGNSPIAPRLDWAKENSISFYFSFRDAAYMRIDPAFIPYTERGYPLLSLPFGANTLHYYPVPDIARDIIYSFLASTNHTKGARYKAYAHQTTKRYPGFIHGPQWKHVKNFVFNRDRDRYIYARSKIGINIHLEDQIAWASETNERTYQLAACGVPQVTDAAKILPQLYSEGALFVASTPSEFTQHVETILSHPDVAMEHALKAQKETFEKHTSLHRAESFVEQLQAVIDRHNG